MTKLYIKYNPPRRGLDMVEYLQNYLTDCGTGITFSPCFYDYTCTFGVLEGSGDELSRIIRVVEARHGVVRYTPEEFAGASVHAFQPYSGTEDPNEPGYIAPENRPNWVAWLAAIGITVEEGDQLARVKDYKSNLLKEIAKKKFCDDNDSLADLSKAVLAITVHYNDFTPEEKIIVDTQIATLKAIYTKDVAISGLTTLTTQLQNILIDYYTAKLTVDAAETVGAVNAVVYE